MKKIFLLVLFACNLFVQTKAQNLTMLGHLTYTSSLASCWGYSDGNGHEYALVGAYGGLSIVDITTPTNPVQVQFVATNNSSWHEMKTWSHYAYVVNESGGGMLIVDLSNLPGAVTHTNWTGGALGLSTGHSISVDANGYAYINGSNIGAGGVLFLNLNLNPANPTYVGAYQGGYVHDCYVRSDTMWAAEIYNGLVRVVNVANKTTPVVIGQQATPGNFTHNCWLSGNSKYLFTTDEVTNSIVTSYDVSNLSNITELDRFQGNPGTNSIAHNVHVKGNFLVIAYYRDGVVLADATHPNNVIKIGSYDTSPNYSGNGYNGCWAVDPYLPSGNIIAADIEAGLYVLSPNYVQACYLEGQVTNYTGGAAVNGATVQIVGGPNGSTTTTNLSGNYATGLATAGTYTIQFSKTGFYTKTVSVNLANGVTNNLNVTLKSTSLTQCVAPINLSATNITSTSATLHWSDELANSYIVKLRNLTSAGGQNMTVSTNSAVFSNLTLCNNYKFRVIANCPNSTHPKSAWKNFSTIGCKEFISPDNVSQNAVSVYPNPFTNQIHISFSVEEESPVHIALFDITGKQITDVMNEMKPEGDYTFDVDGSELAPGMYLCRIAVGESVMTKKVVKTE